VASIVHTHGHVDHISATEDLLADLGQDVPIAAHPADAYLYAAAERQPMAALTGYPLPATLGMPSVELRDGTEIAVGTMRLRVIHTPGHTPGSICLLAGDAFVLSGDTLFRRGIGRTDLSGGDEDAIYESILTRLYTLPPALIVYPGHGPSTTIGEERRENPFVHAQGM
jgi:glyoxylase-like metal-dependent hydrolase (beta-lactamase superfamily II)